MENIENISFDAILLIHTKEKRAEQFVRDGDTEIRLNAEFHMFLIDKYDYQNVWIAESDAIGRGTDQFAELYDRISNEPASKLKENGFIK